MTTICAASTERVPCARPRDACHYHSRATASRHCGSGTACTSWACIQSTWCRVRVSSSRRRTLLQASPPNAPRASVICPCAHARSLSGFVANFAQEVMKGQLSLSVWGLSGEGVELFSRSEAFAFSLNSQLFFLDHVHEFDTDQGPLCSVK